MKYKTKFNLIVLLMLVSIGMMHGQDFKFYRYDTDLLPKEFHEANRVALRKEMPDKSIAVIFSSPVRNRSNDDDYDYHQSPNLYYLTGFTEPNAMLLVFKEEQTIGSMKTNEILFVEDRNPKRESWTGRRLGKNGVSDVLGIRTGMVNKDFEDLEIEFKKFDAIWYDRLPKGAVHEPGTKVDLFNLIDQFKKKTGYPADNMDGYALFNALAKQRMMKKKDELALMQKAIDMTCEGHKEVMKAAEPGMYEYQIQAILEYEFKKNGSEYVGFPSICGGGENSCILHYESNRRKLKDKDLIVIDIGAEYHGYSADVTRTIPISGKYSEEQKTIYNLVYRAQQAGFNVCKPGVSFFLPGDAATKIIKNGLLELGIIKDEFEYSKYFPHGTSHHLGLDVHDVEIESDLSPGNVITVEPGIYIPAGSDCDPKWWNIGVRIEDDVLITDTGHQVLSDKAPRTIEEIENLMKETSIFNEKK